MAPTRKSQKSKGVATSRESKSKGTKRRNEVEMRQHHAELNKHFKTLLCFRDALYHPVTKKKLLIVCVGTCLKSDCKPKATRHMVKVAMPESCRHQFRNFVVPSNLIGKRVVCFAHFTYDEQIQYLTTGSFPPNVTMIQYTKTSEKKGPRHSGGALKKDNSWVRQTFQNNRYSSNLKLQQQSACLKRWQLSQ